MSRAGGRFQDRGIVDAAINFIEDDFRWAEIAQGAPHLTHSKMIQILTLQWRSEEEVTTHKLINIPSIHRAISTSRIQTPYLLSI